MCGHPRDAKKVSVTGADRLRECTKHRGCMGVLKECVCRTVRLRECPLGELLLNCFLRSQHRQEIKRENQNPKPMDTAAPRAGTTPRRAKESFVLGLVFPIKCRKNPRRPGILLFSDRPRYSRQDNRAQTRRIGSVSIFPTRPRF